MNLVRLAFPALLSLCLCGVPLQAATLGDAQITEFLARNSDGLEDGDGDRSDWIEIWNSSGSAGDLGGWYLTDDPANLTKWTFPAVEMQGGGYLLVFASGKDRNDLAAELHCNFKLGSTAGGYLALVKPDGITIASEFAGYPEQFADIAYGSGFETAQAITLVETGDTAKWHVPEGPVASWTETVFDDSTWPEMDTGIGFDSASGGYLEYFGGDFQALRSVMLRNNATVYIRIAFDVPDLAGITDLVLGMRWEDGFVAHLNGTEIQRQRAPATPAWDSSSDPATNRSPESDAVTFFEYPLTTGGLVAGTNVLAIQGLNAYDGSSDLLISPRLTATRQNTIDLVGGFFPEPTPGGENSQRFDGITADTKFSVDRGLYDAPFDLAITSATPDATIRYTTDGSAPSETEGTVYQEPVNIAGTTVVRAMAYKTGFRPTDVDTHTYIFPGDVVAQPAMRTEITADPVYGPQMVDALTSIPTVALNFAGNDIDRDEIPVSVELLNFEAGQKQVDAGVVRFGSYVTNFAKRSVRLQFRSEYGPSRLDFPLFDGFDYTIPPTEDFDSLDLRAGNHDMTHRGAYMSNRFTDDSTIEMGQLAPHGRFVHLYFNGQYRGQYHLRERWNAAMLADYFPGSEEEYDTINANNSGWNFMTGDLQDGDLDDWTEIRTTLNGAGPYYTEVKDKLDLANLIDFMLLWTYGTSESEFRAGGSVENDIGFKFLIKDADGFLQLPGGTHTGNLPPGGRQPATHAGPLNAMSRLRSEAHPDFMTLLADRIHKHYFNDGALTPAMSSVRLQRRVDEVQLSILAEIARWGSHAGRAAHTPTSWQAYQDHFFNTEFPALTDERLGLLHAANMYPDIIAPVLSQHGGSLPPGVGVTMSTGATAIYYTLDGSDPRSPGGAVSGAATLAPFEGDPPVPQDFIDTGAVWSYLDDGSDQGTAWRAPAFDDAAWAEGPSELGYTEGDEATLIGYVDVDPASGLQRNATTYFRHQVDISSPASFSHFSLELKYDDGAAIYINGDEVVRTDNLPAGATFDTYTTTRTPSESTYFEFTIPTSAFVDGVNTVAVEIHNERPGSADISFDLRLRSVVDASTGDNVTEPLVLDSPSLLNARAYDSATGDWSALTSAFFSIDSTPASASNIVISEIHYHPLPPSAPGELAVSDDQDDFEFIELLNIGGQPVELTGVHFSDGITFAFADNTLLDPGERGVLVRDVDAFRARYGAAIAIAGEYSGRLSNDGERIALSLTGLGDLRQLTYNDQPPWPTPADGSGYSLVLRDPASNPDHGLPENWAGHAVIGGSPGAADAVQSGAYAAWKFANGITDDADDGDFDGLAALLEYALGTSPTSFSGDALPAPGVTAIGDNQFLTISYDKNPAATDITIQLQSSTDLALWQNEIAIEVAPGVYRTDTAITPGAQQYLRLLISQQ